VFSTNTARTIGLPYSKEKEPMPRPYIFHKIKSKLITDLNAKCSQFSKRKWQGKNLGDLGFGNKFTDSTPKVCYLGKI
jgi:hypothetical protein